MISDIAAIDCPIGPLPDNPDDFPPLNPSIQVTPLRVLHQLIVTRTGGPFFLQWETVLLTWSDVEEIYVIQTHLNQYADRLEEAAERASKVRESVFNQLDNKLTVDEQPRLTTDKAKMFNLLNFQYGLIRHFQTVVLENLPDTATIDPLEYLAAMTNLNIAGVTWDGHTICVSYEPEILKKRIFNKKQAPLKRGHSCLIFL